MDLRHLRYFVVLADELHFRRAAERLGITQPPLTQQIKQLEAELGTRLFQRLKRGVELTETGMQLLDSARAILEQVERLKLDVQRRVRGETGRIVVGFAGAIQCQPLVPRIVQAFRERYPDVAMTPEQSSSPRLLAGLRAGTIDVAFVRPPLDLGSGLTAEPIIEEPMVIALPAGHRLAGLGAIALEQLANETFVLAPSATCPGLHAQLIASCKRAGFAPRLREDASQLISIVPIVATGFGVALVPQSLQLIGGDLICYKPIEGSAPTAVISLAYRSGESSAAVRNFIGITREKTGSKPPHAAPRAA